MLHHQIMKSLALFLTILFSSLAVSAKQIGAEFQPSSEITYLSDNVTLGTSDGTWCAVTIRSSSNGIGGIGSYMYRQVDSSGVKAQAPLIGAVRISNAYKFLLQGDDLTVEIRDVTNGQLLCSLSGNQKKVRAQGTWVWPTANPLDGADFCGKNQTPTADQQLETATLEIVCK